MTSEQMEQMEWHHVYFISWETTREGIDPFPYYGTLSDTKALCERHFSTTRSVYKRAEIVRASEPSKVIAVIQNPRAI